MDKECVLKSIVGHLLVSLADLYLADVRKVRGTYACAGLVICEKRFCRLCILTFCVQLLYVFQSRAVKIDHVENFRPQFRGLGICGKSRQDAQCECRYPFHCDLF